MALEAVNAVGLNMNPVQFLASMVLARPLDMALVAFGLRYGCIARHNTRMALLALDAGFEIRLVIETKPSMLHRRLGHAMARVAAGDRLALAGILEMTDKAASIIHCHVDRCDLRVKLDNLVVTGRTAQLLATERLFQVRLVAEHDPLAVFLQAGQR